MPYLDTSSRTTSPTSNEQNKPLGRMPVLNGLYKGFVKDSSDVQMNGRLRVWIPELGTAPDEEQGWIIVNYCSPFAGATNVDTISKANISTFEGTQTSYGMWMIPPDINNIVLVMFINGDSSAGVWIGCLYNQFMNNMVPGVPANTNNYQYQGTPVPVSEYNKWDTKVTNPEAATKPVDTTKFKGLGNQGLIGDQGRGITTTGARRESPSNVFGILTPGPVIDETAAPGSIRRKGGSAFIMDDGTGTEYIQLVTKTGAQIKIDETNGFVYLINRDGTAWVQMDEQGNVDIFGATNISMRAQQDINLRADRNINLEAGQNIYMKAAKDTTSTTTKFTYDVNNNPTEKSTPFNQYVGEGKGQGGNIVIQALNNIHTTVEQNMLTVVKKDASLRVTKDLFITVGGHNKILVSGNYALSTTGNQDFKSSGTVNVESNVDYNLKVSGNIKESSASFNVRSSLLNIDSSVGITGSLNASGGIGVSGMLNVAGGAVIGPGVSLGVPGTVGPITGAAAATGADTATEGAIAEIKPVIEKINILPGWVDSNTKFKRMAEAFDTTVSTLPTFEPCPEHSTFSLKNIAGYTPRQNEGARTYQGSGGAGNGGATTPESNTTPGANNTDLAPEDTSASALTKDFNMPAYECQLKIHEGVKYKSYLDSLGLPTGGIGHLLRANEISKYPVPTEISVEQVATWFQSDAAISIGGAQRLLGTDVWGELTDIRKRACADLCYNMGEGRLSKFKRFIAAIRAKDYNAAGLSLRNSVWFTQVGRRGPNIIAMIVQNIDPNNCDKKFK